MWYGCIGFIWYMVCMYNQTVFKLDDVYPMDTDPWNLVDDFMKTRAYEHLLFLDEFSSSLRMNITFSGWDYFDKVQECLKKEMRKAKFHTFGFQICYGFYRTWCETYEYHWSTYDEVIEELRHYLPGVLEGIYFVDYAGFDYQRFLLGEYDRGWAHGYE